MSNGEHVNRGELAAHLRWVGEAFATINTRLERIESRLDAKPVQHWLVGRTSNLIDKMLPLALVAIVTFLITHS